MIVVEGGNSMGGDVSKNKQRPRKSQDISFST
jgi:hypothetical protein